MRPVMRTTVMRTSNVCDECGVALCIGQYWENVTLRMHYSGMSIFPIFLVIISIYIFC